MQSFIIKTKKKKQVVDITEKINDLLKKEDKKEGIAFVFCLHTTCCLTTADLDPGTDEDYLKALAKMFPKGEYNHPHNPDHVGDHIMSSLVGASVLAPIERGVVRLGQWQRIVLIELNGPRERELVLQIA
jgi:secondary thiamine-phosphate synthase enzyme